MRRIFWIIIRKILFLFDAEAAHLFTIGVIQRTPSPVIRILSASGESKSSIKIAGVEFGNRLGLAAGFDKNAELIQRLPEFGFGFAEAGTVTLRPQQGNPLPRLFRDPATESLFNSMGFNNHGCEAFENHLKSFMRARKMGLVPKNFRVGANIGKGRSTSNEEASFEYGSLAGRLARYCDYLVVNISSPNTPDLRNLQSAQEVSQIVSAVVVAMEAATTRPVFLKLAPEIDGEGLTSILNAAQQAGVSGFILTNTLGGSREGQSGGWSGGRLREHSLKSLVHARSRTDLPIVSSGGIMNVQDARERLEAGANLIQIYSGWVYQGPDFVSRILAGLESD